MPRDASLGLLLIFEAIAAERSVSRAAVRLNMSQSAVSHALKRLRDLLGDPLFVRTRTGMQPTAHAQGLAEQVAPLLIQMRSILAPVEFDPLAHDHVFRIVMSEYSAAALFEPLAAALATDYPRLRLNVAIQPLHVGLATIAAGSADFLFAPAVPPASLAAIDVLEDGGPTILMAADHPLATGELSLERYAAARHAYLPLDGMGQRSGLVDQELARRGLQREIFLTIPYAALVPQIIARTDLVMVTTARLAQKYAGRLDLRARPLPLDFDRLTIRLIWHSVLSNRAADRWFRDFTQRVCADLRVDPQDGLPGA